MNVGTQAVGFNGLRPRWLWRVDGVSVYVCVDLEGQGGFRDFVTLKGEWGIRGGPPQSGQSSLFCLNLVASEINMARTGRHKREDRVSRLAEFWTLSGGA